MTHGWGSHGSHAPAGCTRGTAAAAWHWCTLVLWVPPAHITALQHTMTPAMTCSDVCLALPAIFALQGLGGHVLAHRRKCTRAQAHAWLLLHEFHGPPEHSWAMRASTQARHVNTSQACSKGSVLLLSLGDVVQGLVFIYC